MNLVIDLGNTTTKIAIFDRNILINLQIIQRGTDFNFEMYQTNFSQIKNIILSSVRNKNDKQTILINEIFPNLIELNSNTKIPVKNNYKTKETLGKDRIAAVVGAISIFPENNILVIDAGSAITFDVIDGNKQYLGGNISPGMSMRFKALCNFTDKLPLLSMNDSFEKIGTSTNEAIISGVQYGLIYEIEGYISYFSQQYRDLKVIFAGGDAFFFVKRLKNSIFAEPNLVLIGLNQILEYNVNNE